MTDVSTQQPRPSWVDLSARAELTLARRKVLELVESTHHPMTAAEVASELDLHHNTVREHLDALVDAGFVEVSSKPTGRRGRPALRYASTAPGPSEVLDSYLTLLDAISETLGTGEKARETAREIGRRWARMTPALEELEDPGPDATPEQRIARILPTLSLMGFAPTVKDHVVALKACPLVTRNRVPHPLVCSMHEGYLNEVYERVGLNRTPANDVGARTRLSLIPRMEDGCHIVVES